MSKVIPFGGVGNPYVTLSDVQNIKGLQGVVIGFVMQNGDIDFVAANVKCRDLAWLGAKLAHEAVTEEHNETKIG